MSLPSSTEASESKKKLQWASWRPSHASDAFPLASRKRSVAPQRWPLSWATSERLVFSPLARAFGSAGYLPRSSMRTTLSSEPALPYSAAVSIASAPMPEIAFFTVDSKANVPESTARVSVQKTSWPYASGKDA